MKPFRVLAVLAALAAALLSGCASVAGRYQAASGEGLTISRTGRVAFTRNDRSEFIGDLPSDIASLFTGYTPRRVQLESASPPGLGLPRAAPVLVFSVDRTVVTVEWFDSGLNKKPMEFQKK